MNIFVTSSNPAECAQMLDDVRLNKMIVETAQILSTALWAKGVTHPDIYKPISNSRHPCVLWARRSQSNFLWLCHLGAAMVTERKHRGFHRVHKSSPIITLCTSLGLERVPFSSVGLTPYQNSSMYKDDPDVHRAYRQTMRRKWDEDTIALTWHHRGEPSWRREVETVTGERDPTY